MLAALKMPCLNDIIEKDAVSVNDSIGGFQVAVALGFAKLAAEVKEQCQYPLAKQLLQHALTMTEAADPIGDPVKRQLARWAIQNSLASLLEAQGDLRQAEALARSALGAARSALVEAQPEDRELVQLSVHVTSNTLATVCLRAGTRAKLEEAKILFRSIIDTISESDVRMARLHRNLGLVYLEMGLLDEAEQWLRLALNISRSRQPDGPETAETLVCTAQVLAQRSAKTGQRMLLAEAADMAWSACNILATARGAHHASFATAVCSAAEIFLEFGLVDHAERVHRAGVALREGMFGPFSTPVAASLEGIAACLEHKPDGLLEAEQLLLRSLDIRQHILGSAHHTVASVLNLLACNLVTQGTPDKLKRAEALATQAVQTMRAAMGARSPNVVPCLRVLYTILKKRSKYRAAMQVWLEMRTLAHPWWCLAGRVLLSLLLVVVVLVGCSAYLQPAVLSGWVAGKHTEL